MSTSISSIASRRYSHTSSNLFSHSCFICLLMMSITAFFSYIWFRIQIYLLRLISAIRFRYVQYKYGQLLPKPSLVKNIPIGDHFIRALIYLPPNYASQIDPFPLHIDFHGGGFIFGRPEDDAEFCNYIAKEVGCIVVSLSYRLAPEHPFPAAVHDARAGVQYFLSSKSQLNIDTSKISLGGFSAGGNLAIVTSTQISCVTALIPFYPRTDFTIPHETKSSLGPDVMKFVIPLSRRAHLPPGLDLSNPLLSPMFADPNSLPKRTLIITAEYDTSRAEAETFVEKMHSNGKHILFWRADRCVHAWNFMDGTAYANKEKKWQAYAMCSNELKEAFSDSNVSK